MDTKQIQRVLEIDNANRFQVDHQRMLAEYTAAAYTSSMGLTEFNLIYIQANLQQALACCRKIEIADHVIQSLHFPPLPAKEEPPMHADKEIEPQRAQRTTEEEDAEGEWNGASCNWLGRACLWVADKFG